MSTVLSQKHVKIRKPHHCWGCTVEYPVGTVMHLVNSVDMGKAMGTYWCEVCDAYLDERVDPLDQEDGWFYSEVSRGDDYDDFRNEYKQRGNNEVQEETNSR
jgi:transcription elongation factor Elf1